MKTKKKMAVPCSVSARLLTYGLYAVFCQLVLIILCMATDGSTDSLFSLFYTYRAYFDYPAVSFALVIFGSLLIDYVVIREGIEL